MFCLEFGPFGIKMLRPDGVIALKKANELQMQIVHDIPLELLKKNQITDVLSCNGIDNVCPLDAETPPFVEDCFAR